MLRNAFWLAIIAGAAVAILAGFAQGSMATHPPPFAQIRSSEKSHVVQRALPVAAARAGSDVAVDDEFAQDDVVVDRVRVRTAAWQPESLAVVVGSCGHSIPIESGFLRLQVPLTFVVDASGPQAAGFANLVRANNDTLLVQVSSPPTAVQLDRLHDRLGAFDGVAARDPSGMAAALHGTGLLFFDERGDAADARTFAAVGVPLVSRDATADDRSGANYIGFMLRNAAALSRRTGRVVVLVRPLPPSLGAIRMLLDDRYVRLVDIR